MHDNNDKENIEKLLSMEVERKIVEKSFKL